eukprot:c39689_g1_i1 orf=223-588(+)
MTQMSYTGSNSVLMVTVYRSSSLSQRLKHPYHKHLDQNQPTKSRHNTQRHKGTHPHTQTPLKNIPQPNNTTTVNWRRRTCKQTNRLTSLSQPAPSSHYSPTHPHYTQARTALHTPFKTKNS